MGFFDTPEAPTPPNPMATAAAQTGTNVSTAIANSYLGNVNQVTPQGTLNNNVTGTFNYTDPTTGQTFNIPRWTATQSMFNPSQYLQNNSDVLAAARAAGGDLNQYAQQHYNDFGRFEGRSGGVGSDTYNQTEQSRLNLAQMANQQSGSLRNLLGTPFNPNASAPGMGDINWLHGVGNPQSQIGATNQFATSYGSGGDIARTFDPGGDITRSYGAADNYSADRSRIEQSMFERVNPQLNQQEDRLRQQLADQGIRYGSQAYQGAYDPFNRQVTDTRLGIVAAGGQEQQRMDQMAAQQAAFRNAAQQQGYTQQLGRAGFWNQAQQQAEGQNAARAAFGNQAAQSQFDQAMARGQFYNQAQNQQLGRNQAIFNAQNQLRNQNLQEQYQLRNQPINEITALLSGSQVQSPSFINAQRNTIPTTDVAGLINQNFAQQNDIYKTGQQFWGDIIGGGLGAAGNVGAGWAASDVRVKENITPMGSVLSTKGELPIYEYDYKGARDDGQRHVGPMAQDVERIDPTAVKTIGGVKHINRDKLGSIFGSA